MLILPTERRIIKPGGPIVLNRDSPQAVGLVAWYPFGSGLNALDEGPIGRYHLDPVGSPAFVIDRDRGRVTDLLTSSSQRFNAALTPMTTHPATICCWHNKDNATDVTFLVELYNASDSGQFMGLMARASNEIRARKDGQTGNAQNADIAGGYTVGAWDFAAAVFASASSMTAFANLLTPVENTTDTGTLIVDGISIGAEMFTTPRSYYGGLIDDVRVYNRALSTEEMAVLYDPNTRFDLYYELGKRSYFFFAQATGGSTAAPDAAAALAAAPAAVVLITALPAAAAAVGAAPALTAGIISPPAASAALGAAPALAAQVGAPVAAAAALVASPAPTGLVVVPFGAAAAAQGVTPNPTTDPAGDSTVATPGAAPSLAAAPSPTALVVALPAAAAAAGSANDPGGAIIVVIGSAAAAQGTASALAVQVSALPAAGAALGNANTPSWSIAATPAAAVAIGDANDPTTDPSPFVFVSGVRGRWRAPHSGKVWT
jgi:hypothetical protein